VTHLTEKELKKMVLLSWQRIEEEKDEIDKINVFPVPDKDTGKNMTQTLKGIKEAIEDKEFKNLEELGKVTLEAALISALGNAGVIYTGFLAGFLPSLDKNPVDAKKLALAFEEGRKRAWKSMFNPKEGTILDVIDATAQAFQEEIERESDIIKIFKKAIEKAKEALMNTREKLEILKKANVVDAGGLGFLVILESYLEALEGEKKEEKKEEKPSEEIRRFIQVLANRYEVVSLIENPKVNEQKIKEDLKKIGNSLDIVQVGNKMKIHIHTDYPDEVRNVLKGVGQIEDLRTEDMAKEVVGEESVRKVSIGLVTEDLVMLLPKIIERYQIELAYTKYDWEDEKNLPGENIFQKMRNALTVGFKTFPKTSQATPKSYFDAYQKQLKRFEKVLCITVSSKISGCYNSAIQAKEMLDEKEKEKVFILDSLSLTTLLVLKAIELIQEQRDIDEVISELKNLIPKNYVYLMIEDPRWLEALGRITKSQANWFRRIKKLRLQPILKLKDGLIQKGGFVFAKDMVEALFKKIFKESEKYRKEGKKIRVFIAHADNLSQAEKLKKMLKENIKAEIPFIILGPPLICAGAGPGTLIVGWMPI